VDDAVLTFPPDHSMGLGIELEWWDWSDAVPGSASATQRRSGTSAWRASGTTRTRDS
jgi:hypothetical protein